VLIPASGHPDFGRVPANIAATTQPSTGFSISGFSIDGSLVLGAHRTPRSARFLLEYMMRVVLSDNDARSLTMPSTPGAEALDYLLASAGLDLTEAQKPISGRPSMGLPR
jgi:hypothetical protein